MKLSDSMFLLYAMENVLLLFFTFFSKKKGLKQFTVTNSQC